MKKVIKILETINYYRKTNYVAETEGNKYQILHKKDGFSIFTGTPKECYAFLFGIMYVTPQI